MQRKLFYCLFSSMLLFAQCKNEKTKSSETAVSSPEVSGLDPSVSPTIKGFYKHLKGTIDSFPITMDLVQLHNSTNDNISYNFRGHYYYDKYQQPIGLYGELDSTGNIVLHEYVSQDKDITFAGKIDANGSFSGTWQDTASKRKLPFSLKETYHDGALTLDFHTFEDSVKGWKNASKSPLGTFDMQLLLPAKAIDAGISAFLKDKIFMGINGDTIEKSYAKVSVESLQKTKRDTFFKYYLETMAEEKPDTTQEVPAGFNYAESSSVDVIFNEKGLLSLGFGEYSYGGGAHGNHATMIASYDWAQKKVLKLTDVFQPKFEKTVNAALANALRRQFNLKKNDPLKSILFDNSIQSTTNFCITQKGILFLYNPYEIAAYAYGEIELFVPFEEVKNVLNPQFLTFLKK